MREGFFIPEKGYSEQDQELRNEITSIRIGKVIDYLMGNIEPIIDFSIKTPIISGLEYNSFEKQTFRSDKFEELPKHIREKVYQAEHIKHYDEMFRKWLLDQDIYHKEYKNKNPKTQQDLFYEWLFANNFDVGILEL